jgi:hypothetical protein
MDDKTISRSSNVDPTRTVILFMVSGIAILALAELDGYRAQWIDSFGYFRQLPDWCYPLCVITYCVVTVVAPLASLAIDNKRGGKNNHLTLVISAAVLLSFAVWCLLPAVQ